MNSAAADMVDSDNRGDDSHCTKAEANTDSGVDKRKCMPI